MKRLLYARFATALTFLGISFSGYLSAVKLLTTKCAFNEACPYFLGYPACWYGFAMFLVMFIVSVGALRRAVSVRRSAKINLVISIIGTLFAGYFVIPEIVALFAGIDREYSLVLPTCVYGLVFYVAIGGLSLILLFTARPEYDDVLGK